MERENKDYALQICKQQDVKFVRLWFTDILGSLRSFAITVEELEAALDEGAVFDGSSVEGFDRIEESHLVAMPDPSTFQLIPWRPRERGVARLFCDILHPDGRPFEGDPRYVLKRNLKRAADLGFTFYVGPQLEYFYFKSADVTEGLDEGGYFDLTPLDMARDLRRDTVLTLEDMGIGVESSHHDVAPSQHEVALRFTDALTMADNTMTCRLVVKEVALAQSVYATFMPKPLPGENGSGMHIHQSLFRGERNAFFDANDKYHLSPISKAFIAGLLRHSQEITLVTNQWVNSYKRLAAGVEVPFYVCWSCDRPWSVIRVPEYKRGKEIATRIEYRAPDPACNPYLAFAVLIAAGLAGVEREYACPEPVEENVFHMADAERRELGIEQLPRSLWEAIECAKGGELLRSALGEYVLENLLTNKKIEWCDYSRQVTDYEVRRYLPVL